MQRPGTNGAAKARPPPAGGNALVTFDAQLAKQQEEAQLAKERPKPRNDYLDCYTGPKVKWEDTGLYKALVKSQDIEEELTKIRNLIRKRTDPGYDPDDEEDFKVAPVRKFDSKADYYKLLDVDDFASVKDIKGAYKKLALQYHPDKNRDKKPDKLREMQDEFEKIQEAYEILSDRATRRQYDRARFDEARAKSQGMNSSFYSQKTNTDSNFWGRWGGAAEGKEGGKAKLPTKATKLPKAGDLRLEVKISLEKALRGGLKIREVKRDRMQRAFGGTSQTLKTVNIQIDPGQADGTEYRLPGDGHWPSFNVSPGDLVVSFRHKAHAFLRQAEGGRDKGALQLAVPLQARAKATQATLAVWSPTFKGSMVLLRFRNPLLDLAPSKACNITFILEGEGLPIPNTPMKRGPLAITVHVQLDGPALVPSFNSSCCKETLLRRHVKHYNHQGTLRVTLTNPRAATLPVRKYVAVEAKERAGAKVPFPCVVVVWESSKDTDLVAFAQAAAALGHHAVENPQGYGWCCNVQLLPRALPYAQTALSDAELAEDVAGPMATVKPGTATAETTKPRATLTEVQEFLLRFDLGPPEGFHDLPEPEEELAAATTLGAPGQSTAEVTVDLQEAEGEEEKELTRLIREKQSDLDQVKRQWVERKERLSGERQEEEGQLRELLEKDKKRELERVEREMNGLRSNFEFQLQAEKKWVDEFMQNNNYQNQWVCVFKPAMVIRNKPQEDGPITRRVMFDEVVKAKTWKVTEDHWIQLETDEWALTWHKVHGQLLQRWFNAEQHRFRDLQAKIDERRKVRNETFVAYRRKKKEIEEWSIPPGPSAEEKCEIEDEECEQLHFLMEPIVKELKGYKRRLRELRQKRVEAAVERQRKVDGFLSNAPLPKGFEESLEAPEEQTVPTPEVEKRPWEETKQAADKAFKDKDWNTALSLYSKALQSQELEALQRATLLSNRALCYNRLFEWNKSLEDAVDATVLEAEWPKGWLRRATAELRLAKTREALSSLKRGFSCAGKTAGQFLALTTECEAALYNDKMDEVDVPDHAVGRIAKFKEEGDGAFKQSNYGVAVLCYTRALYHRSMMESKEEAVVLSNRSAGFLKLDLANEALADALAASEKDQLWSKPLVRAGQAALQLDDFKAAYQNFAKARRLDEHYEAANDGVQSCLQKIIRWEYSAAARRWSRFAQDRQRPREGLRLWALSDVFFDQHGVPEWCKSLSSSFFRDDVLMLAGNLADSLPQLRFALTVLKSKFRRIFYVPGNHDLWVRRVTLSSIMKGEQVKDERDMGDSISKFLEECLVLATGRLVIATGRCHGARGRMLARIGLGGLALVVTAAVLFLGFEPKSDTFLAPRRLSSPGSLVSDGCCQFADHFQGVNWYDANVRSDFLKNVLSVERRFFAAPGAAFDADSGMTYDGTSLDLTTGDVQPEGLRLFSAPSKESLHISLLALALQKPEDVLPEHSQLLSLLYSQDEALDILEKKVSSLEDFDRRFPAFGGYLPWFCSRGYSQKTGNCKGLDESFSYIEPKTDPSEKISLPALDNGQMAWAITALVQVLGKRRDESSQIQSLAQRWEQRLQRMKDTAVNLFYDGPGTGTVRAIATLKDVHVDAAKNASNAYNAENYVLWDPFEGEMIVVFLDIFGNWSNYTDSQAEKDKIWNIKQQHVAAVEFNASDKTFVIQQGFWFSSHEQWKILQLPYLEIPLVRQLFTNGEMARLTFSNEQQLNGLLASVNAPIGFQCDSAQGYYCGALGIQSLAEQPIWTDSVLTPYGAFPSILIDPAAGLAWYQQMLRMPRAQTALGSLESFTQNGQEVAPIVTWDAKATSVLAMLGGTGKLVRDHLQQSSGMDNFVNRVQNMYAKIFDPELHGELGGSGSTVLPMPSEKALPSDPAASYAKCGCPSR